MTEEEIDRAREIRTATTLRDRRVKRYAITAAYAKTGIAGSWQDIEEGKCQRCGIARRLYQPADHPEFRVCAPCSQVLSSSSIPNTARGDD